MRKFVFNANYTTRLQSNKNDIKIIRKQYLLRSFFASLVASELGPWKSDRACREVNLKL